MQKCLKSALFLRADLEECQFGFIKKPHLCFCIEVYEKTTLLLTWAMPSDAFLMSLWTLRNPIKVLFNTEGLLLCKKSHIFIWYRFGGSSSYISALDVSDAGPAAHAFWLPQPLLQSPEEYQVMCQHDSEKHVYQWLTARPRWGQNFQTMDVLLYMYIFYMCS